MKYILYPFCLMLLMACSAETEEEKSPTDQLYETLEENEELKTDFIEKEPPAPGSTKDMLLGTWYSETSDIKIILSKDRYVSYVDGRKNWDNDWELSTAEELGADNIDDNGSIIHVISEDNGEPFYSMEIKSLDENNMHAQVVGSSGDGPYDHVYWSRTNNYVPDEESGEVDIGW